MANRSGPNGGPEYQDVFQTTNNAMSESTRDDHNWQPPSGESQSTPSLSNRNSSKGQHSATLKASPSDPAGVRPPKACETCRALKIGCIVDENGPSGACRRCVKTKRRCVRLPVARRRRKRTDARVTDLEKKMEDLVVALEASRRQMSPPDVGSETAFPETDKAELGIPLSIRDGSHEMQVIDLIDQGVMEAKNAYQLFEFYKEEMSGMFPFVVFSSGIQAETVRHEKPLLFLSVITVAAGVLKPELHRYLTSEVWRILADRVIYTGAPSVEVIQALQVMAVYYTHHTGRDNYRNFHHLIHSAAVMAMDAGMGKRIRPNQSRLFKDPWEHGLVREAPNSAEIRRTWLGAYYLCSTVATILRRPHLLRWNPYTKECLDILASAPDALPSDAWLAHMIRAEHIVEEVHFQFSMDDPMSSVSLADRNAEIHIKLFEKKMQDWRAAVTADMPQALVELTDAHSTLYIHEIAMHHEHDIDNFKPPFAMMAGDAIPDVSYEINTTDPVPLLTICLHSIHRIFDAFLSIDPIKLRIFPCLVFVRILYAGIALLKLSSIAMAPGSPLASVFGPDDLKVEEYLEMLVIALAETSNHGKYRFTGEFWEQVSMMRLWWLKNGSSRIPPKESQIPVPNETIPMASSDTAEPLYGTTAVEASGVPPRNTDMSTSIPSAFSTNPITTIHSDFSQANETTGSLASQAQGNLEFFSIDTDVNMDLSSFDMLGQFDNGFTWSWPGFDFESVTQTTRTEPPRSV